MQDRGHHRQDGPNHHSIARGKSNGNRRRDRNYKDGWPPITGMEPKKQKAESRHRLTQVPHEQHGAPDTLHLHDRAHEQGASPAQSQLEGTRQRRPVQEPPQESGLKELASNIENGGEQEAAAEQNKVQRVHHLREDNSVVILLHPKMPWSESEQIVEVRDKPPVVQDRNRRIIKPNRSRRVKEGKDQAREKNKEITIGQPILPG
jgi:hypothetical protein